MTQPFIIQPPDTLPPEPKFAGQFYEAVGRFVVSWGSFETHLDALCRMAINIQSASPERPLLVSLQRKLDQMKEVFRDTPQLKPFHAAIQTLSSVTKEWGQDRDFLIHSIFSGFEDGPPPKIVLRHIEHPKGLDMRVEVGRFTLAQIDGFTSQVRKHHIALVGLLAQVESLQDHHKLRIATELSQSVAPATPPIRL